MSSPSQLPPRRRPSSRAATITLLATLAGCITTTEDGKVVPRGNQKLPFDQVEKLSAKLRIGMNRLEVTLLLGSPAEADAGNNLWVYLPERYGLLIPARALRLEFAEGVLAEYGFRPIVLGARL